MHFVYGVSKVWEIIADKDFDFTLSLREKYHQERFSSWSNWWRNSTRFAGRCCNKLL